MDSKKFTTAGLEQVAPLTLAAPLMRVQFILQCHGELIKSGKLVPPGYSGGFNCLMRTYRIEGLSSLWRGNVIGCFGAVCSVPVRLLAGDYFGLKWSLGTGSSVETSAKKIFVGGAVCALTSALTYPLAYCRLRLANDIISDAGKRQFKHSSFDILRKTWATDGITGVYRGLVISSVAFFIQGGCFFAYHNALQRRIAEDQSYMSRPGLSLAIGFPVLSAILAYPFETIRVRMMMRSCEAEKYTGALDCARQMIRYEGVLSLWNGVGVYFAKSFYLILLAGIYEGIVTDYGQYLPEVLKG